MVRLFVLQIIIIFLFLPNNSIATNQNVFDDAKIYFEKKDYNQSKFLFQKFLWVLFLKRFRFGQKKYLERY